MSLVESLSFKHPFTCMLAGPSQSGKSTLLANILEYNQVLITPTPTRILYCYARWSDGFNKLKLISPKIEFHEGLPDIDTFAVRDNNLLILDDLMSQRKKTKRCLSFSLPTLIMQTLAFFLLAKTCFRKVVIRVQYR